MVNLITETDRTIIRELNKNDIGKMYELSSKEEIMKYVGDGKPLTIEQITYWIEKSQQNYKTYGFGCWAIIDNSTNELIGYCGLIYPKNSKDVEIIYALRKEYWGKGLASEIVKEVINIGFIKYGLNEIWATVDPENKASIRILEKVRMSFIKEEPDENNISTYFYKILKVN